MRVTIKTEPRTRQKKVVGFFKKMLSTPEEITEYYVHTTVILSEEENELLKHGNIADTEIYEFPYYLPHDEFMAYAHQDMAVARLMQSSNTSAITPEALVREGGFEARFPDILQAQHFEEAIRSTVLPTFKMLLERARRSDSTSDTFEL